ncbi:MAG: hypothetical protein WB610_09455, partial [Rhodomicrobium sp.]
TGSSELCLRYTAIAPFLHLQIGWAQVKPALPHPVHRLTPATIRHYRLAKLIVWLACSAD